MQCQDVGSWQITPLASILGTSSLLRLTYYFTGAPFSEEELYSMTQAPPDDPVRERGLILHYEERPRRAVSPPSPTFNVDDGEDPLDRALAAEPPVMTKAMKRASSVSILSGLGVKIPDKLPETPASPTSQSSASPTKSLKKGSKLRNFFGQRPPSELITNHLAEYFPFTEKKVLERTRRQSMMRQGGAPGRRDSIISFTMPASRFSVSTLGSQRSPRMSIASSASATAVDHSSVESDANSLSVSDATAYDPPRLSLSTDDGHSVDLSTEGLSPPPVPATMNPHLLPPVAFPSESLSESVGLADSNARASRRMSTASKRMSYITELRSKRDRSDTASLMTVDEITAEVESRQESGSGDSDEWTKVEMADDQQSVKAVDEDEDVSEEEDEDEEEYDEDEEADETATDEEELGKAVVSRGMRMQHTDTALRRADYRFPAGEKTIKWIKGALIGAGSFGKVYLGMDAASGLLMAVKQVELPTGSAPNEERKKSMLSALEREIELLRDLHHENIVQYHCTLRSPLPWCSIYSSSSSSFLYRRRPPQHLPGVRSGRLGHLAAEELRRVRGAAGAQLGPTDPAWAQLPP